MVGSVFIPVNRINFADSIITIDRTIIGTGLLTVFHPEDYTNLIIP